MNDPAAILLDIDATAKALSLCSKTVRKLVHDGLLPAVRIGRAVRFDPRDFGPLIDRLKAGPGAGGEKNLQSTGVYSCNTTDERIPFAP